MLDQKEIEKRLKGVDPQLCAAFAARCSLRALPSLVENKEKKSFWYWDKEKRPKYVLAMLVAQQVSINFSAFGGKLNIVTIDAAVCFSFDAASYVVGDLAYSAAYAVHAATVYAADTSVDDAINAVILSVEANISLEAIILQDLDSITQKNGNISPENFLYSSLWYDLPNKDWQLLFSHFTQAILDLDAGFEHWVAWYKDRIDGKPLNKEQEEKWLNIPSEIKELGAKATNAYIANLTNNEQSQSLQPLNLVRAIFIGNGAAGKTSLIHKLHKEPVVEGGEEMTPGIEIREWPIPKTDIKAKFWDFGGQVMSHSTHQFFLRERCLYVLVVDAGSEREVRENQTANDQAEYWLEHIKSFGNNAPVMLVGNKCDKTLINLDMHALTEKYKNIVGFYPVSCTSEEAEFKLDFDKFQTVLIKQLKTVGTHQVMFTPNQFEVLEQVRKLSRKNAFLDHDKFDALCAKNEIGKEGLDQTAFLGLLDALGEIIHFPDLEWSDAYVLNPRWLTYGVYTLLYSAEAETQQGILSHADVVRILRAEEVKDEQGNVLTYPKSKCGFIINAMTQFKLCYRLPKKGSYYVIPDKLPKEQPDLTAYFDKNAEGTLAFEFSFTGLLPRNVMPNLIVTRHYEITKDNQGKQLVWQRGVIIRNEEHQSTARWKVDYHQRTLQLWVQGREAREYLVILRDKIYEILGAIKGQSVTENVILPELARINTERFRLNTEEVEKITYQSLIEQAKAGRKVAFSNAGNQYDLKQVMGFIMTEERQNKEGANVTYNIENLAALGGVGDNHKVKGKIVLNVSEKQNVAELQESLTALMSHVEKYDADFAIKASAYAELQEINQHLANLENATPETKTKLLQLLTNVKDGTLGAIKLAKHIKESSETVTWLMGQAAVVSAFLAASPL